MEVQYNKLLNLKNIFNGISIIKFLGFELFHLFATAVVGARIL